MKKMPWLKTHWPAISLLVMLGFAVGAQIIVAVEPGACYPNSLQYWSTEQKVPLFACWEFWINRYQTVLAAFIGAAVAFAVVKPVRDQLRQMTRQSSADARTVTREIIAELQEEEKAYQELKSAIGNIEFGFDFMGESPFEGNDANRELLAYIDRSIKTVRSEGVRANSFRGADPHRAELEQKRFRVGSEVSLIGILADALSRIIKHEMSHGASEANANTQIIDLRAKIKAVGEDIDWLITDRRSTVRAERAEIRRLEQEVKGK